jgi:hypothetical protein
MSISHGNESTRSVVQSENEEEWETYSEVSTAFQSAQEEDDKPPGYSQHHVVRRGERQQEHRTSAQVHSVSTGPSSWVSEEYQVQWKWIKTIINELGGRWPDIELFASERQHWCKTWVGPGGEWRDAMQLSWKPSRIHYFWANPPFSKLHSVVQKIKAEKSRGILILPNWAGKTWLDTAHRMSTKKYKIEGQSVFEDIDKQPLPPRRWAVWALQVDGAYDGGEIPDPDSQWRPKTVASHRRKLRAKKRKLTAAERPRVKIEVSDSEDR